MNSIHNKKGKIQLKTIFPQGGVLAFNLISDPLQYMKIHPIINLVEQLESNRFIFHETTSLLFVPYRITYQVLVKNEVSKNKTTMFAKVRKGVGIKLTFSLHQIGFADELLEEIEIWAPPIIRRTIYRKLKRAHLTLHQNVNEIVMQKMRLGF